MVIAVSAKNAIIALAPADLPRIAALITASADSAPN